MLASPAFSLLCSLCVFFLCYAGLKLLVDRERERMLFTSASYAGLRANVRGVSWMGDLEARLQAINGRKIAVGTDFDPRTGELAEKRVGMGVRGRGVGGKGEGGGGGERRGVG